MRGLFSIIGAFVVLIVIAVVAYFAWIGWRETGEPVPEVEVTTERERDAAAAPPVAE